MVKVIVVKRTKTLPFSGPLVSILSLTSGLALSMILLYALAGTPPLALLSAIAYSFTSPTTIKDTLILTLVGASLVLSFKGAVWNIGSEGQIYMGMMAAAWIALFSGLAAAPVIGKILALLLAALAGAAWAAIAGVLRAYAGVDEVPVTLMMNYIAYYIVDILVYGPWRGKHVYGYIRTDEIPQSMWFKYIPGTTATWEALLVTIMAMVFAWLLLEHTMLGLKIKILGSNPNLLRSSGHSVERTIVLALALSGALSGLVGAVCLLGDIHRIAYPVEAQTANYGYIGILVAWLAMLDLRAVPLAAFVISALRVTGITMQIAGLGGVPTVFVFLGSVLLTYTILRVFSEYTVKVRW